MIATLILLNPRPTARLRTLLAHPLNRLAALLLLRLLLHRRASARQDARIVLPARLALVPRALVAGALHHVARVAGHDRALLVGVVQLAGAALGLDAPVEVVHGGEEGAGLELVVSEEQ